MTIDDDVAGWPRYVYQQNSDTLNLVDLSTLDHPDKIDFYYANMKRIGFNWIPQPNGDSPLHIDNWREREKLRLEYERRREGRL